MSPRAVETVIIGAGPSGLAVAGSLRARGLSFEVLEASDAVGSSWRNHYERLHLHTGKKMSALPRMPMPEAYPTYPSRQQVVDYLEAYASRFDIRPTFGARVDKVSLQQGRWQVRYAAAAAGDAAAEPGEIEARYVVVASGYNAVPKRPTWPGSESFAGSIVHSSEYKTGAAYRGKRVLVVGAGNSGAEIAVDLCEHGAAATMCIRGPLHVVPRDIFGIPAQEITVRLSKLPAKTIDRMTLPVSKRLVGDLSRFGIVRPKVGPLQYIEERGRIPLIDIGTIDLIKQGKIGVVGDIAALTETGVTLKGGTHLHMDAIVLATGYEAALNRFVEFSDELTDARGYPTAHGRETILPGLFFVGFRNPWTGALREGAIEAERVADAIADKTERRIPRIGPR